MCNKKIEGIYCTIKNKKLSTIIAVYSTTGAGMNKKTVVYGYIFETNKQKHNMFALVC